MSRRCVATVFGGLYLYLAAAGCGYRSLRGDRVFEQTRVVVMPFAEHGPSGLSAPMAQSLAQRLAAAGIGDSHFSTRPAATLGGSVQLRNAPSATLQGVQTYAVVAEVHAVLSAPSGEALWQRDFSLREEFLPTDPTRDVQPLVSEARRRTALARLAEQAADDVHEALVRDSSWQSFAEATP